VKAAYRGGDQASHFSTEGGYAVSEDNVVKLVRPGTFTDQLTEILRSGARALLTQAVEAEVAEFLAKHSDLKTEGGFARVVRHGHLPEREVMTGIGPVTVASRACAIAALPPRTPPASGSRLQSCRPTRAARRAWRC